MTLDEAIKHCEEVAWENEQQYDKDPIQLGYIEKFYDCKECAEEHRQLAEWLRDYQRLLMIERLQPRKGEWIYYRETGYGNPYGHYECSLCGDGYGYKTNFCPNCGADMREGEDG